MNFSIDNRLFNHILKSGFSHSVNNVEFIVSDCERFCLGFVVPKSLGIANQRNKFKRHCRNIFNLLLTDTKPPVGIIIKPKSISIQYSDLYGAFCNVINS